MGILDNVLGGKPEEKVVDSETSYFFYRSRGFTHLIYRYHNGSFCLFSYDPENHPWLDRVFSEYRDKLDNISLEEAKETVLENGGNIADLLLGIDDEESDYSGVDFFTNTGEGNLLYREYKNVFEFFVNDVDNPDWDLRNRGQYGDAITEISTEEARSKMRNKDFYTDVLYKGLDLS
jgi:hypothetical protein